MMPVFYLKQLFPKKKTKKRTKQNKKGLSSCKSSLPFPFFLQLVLKQGPPIKSQS